MRIHSRLSLLLLAVFVTTMLNSPVFAQCVSLTTLGSAATQNFDSLSNTAASTTNNLTITGWFLTESGGGARDNEQYAVDTGASTTGDMYSYGAAAASDRALGQLRSGTLIPLFGACYTNNTGATIDTLAVAYTGEEWRLGTAARTDQINFEYSLNATDLVTGTWTGVSALNFLTPDTVTTGAKNGNAAADRTALSTTIPSLTIANGATFWIRWTDTDATGADDGLSVDDFSLTPTGGPALPNLTVNDVSLNEGNAGTTSFTFTVSLSAPAGPGGVTFDIATADGTGIAPGDYTTKSLTGQTIPAGSSTYSFTVLVNGDTTPEINETFLVNVTSVTGATVTDGQGQGSIVNDDAAPNLTVDNVTLNEGNAGTTTFTFTVSLSTPAGAGGVTFDIATANSTAIAPGDYTAKNLTGQTIPAGSSTLTFDVLVNGDTTPETDETFFVNVTNVTNAIVTDSQGLGTISNDDITRIHDVQGNGAATPIPGATVTVEGVVIGSYQGTTKLQGFFIQEEDADADADPATSEGIYIFCNTCPTAVAEGDLVKVTGVVSEFNSMTEITASTAGSVVITSTGNGLPTASPIDLPVVGVVNDFYERREGMRVTFVDPLTVSEYFESFRYGNLELYEGGRPFQFTEQNAPSVAGYNAHLAALATRVVIIDDENNAQNFPLTLPNGLQKVFHPAANGGFSVGTQGTDFYRGGDIVNGLTGVLHWSFPGLGADTWRIRPTASTPVTFTVANPRPATAPAVGGAIRAAGMNMLNYFTTIDTTNSNNSGACGPSGTLDCRGADSVAELNRQRERASIVICGINADVFGLMEMENNASATVNDLIGAVNARCGGAHPFTFVNTGGSLGTDAIRVVIIYRTGVLSPVGSALVDLDPVHNRPPTAQTFDVVDATNPAFGERFTIIANHFKSKGCPSTGGDADAGDGQSCFVATRTSQATRLLTWVNNTVLPAAGDPDVLLVGDFNSYGQETPTTTITGGGYTDLEVHYQGASAYSYLFDGQLGHLDYAFASASLLAQTTGADAWHINADEDPLFDYNDEIKDTGENATFEEKPDGSALAIPRVVFQPSSPYRAADHDPVVVGLFAVADLVITKTDSPDPVTAGSNLTYTITVFNNGPDAATTASWSDNLPLGTTFVSMPNVTGWSCSVPSVGANGTVSCSNPSFAVGSSVFTLTVAVSPSLPAATVLSNTAAVTAATTEGNPGDESDTETTSVTVSADLSVTKGGAPDPVTAGANLTYSISVINAGPSDAAGVTFSDTLPAGTTFVSFSSPGGWSCTPLATGATGTIPCSIATLPPGSYPFTLVVKIDASVAAGTVLSNTASVASTSDTNSANNSGTATTTVAASADLSVTKIGTPNPVTAGSNVTYTITVNNAGPSNAATVSLGDTLPAGTTFVSLASPAGWTCTPQSVGSTTPVSCSVASLGLGDAVFTLVLKVDASLGAGSFTNTATVSSATPDPNAGNESGGATTNVIASADLSVAKIGTPNPVAAGTNLTYSITVNNAGPSNAATVSLSDPLPVGTSFVSLSSPGGWTCAPQAVGSTDPLSCSIAGLAPGNSVFTLVVKVDPSVSAGVVLTNTATVTSATSDPNPGNESSQVTTTVSASADLSVTKVGTPEPVVVGSNITYTITVTNSGPSNAANASFSDTLPAGTTFVSLSFPGGWSCSNPAVGAGGVVSCSNSNMGLTSAVFTLVVNVGPTVPGGSVVTNTVTVTSDATDPVPNQTATETTAVDGLADVSITKVEGNDPAAAGGNLSYTITVTNGGPSAAGTVVLADTVPANTTFVSLTQPGGWSCNTPAVGGTGAVDCTLASMPVGSAVFTLVVNVDPSTSAGTVLTNTATVTSGTGDPNNANNSATATTTVASGASLSATKSVTGSFIRGGTVTYSIVITNNGVGMQLDNPGNEFIDILPSSLQLVSASATSGTAVATALTNTVTWNGSLSPGGSVTITIQATIDDDAPGGPISNQGTVSFDGDGNGTNESSVMTSNSTNPGSGEATTFVLGAAGDPAAIPTLDGLGMMLMAAALAGVALMLMRGRV